MARSCYLWNLSYGNISPRKHVLMLCGLWYFPSWTMLMLFCRIVETKMTPGFSAIELPASFSKFTSRRQSLSPPLDALHGLPALMNALSSIFSSTSTRYWMTWHHLKECIRNHVPSRESGMSPFCQGRESPYCFMIPFQWWVLQCLRIKTLNSLPLHKILSVSMVLNARSRPKTIISAEDTSVLTLIFFEQPCTVFVWLFFHNNYV